MRTCFLFGQHDAPEDIRERLCGELEKLVCFEGVTEMIVGHRGSFDRMAVVAIQRILRKKPELNGRILIAYHDLPESLVLPALFEGFYYPIGLYDVPLRYAIVKANQIALEESDYLLTYCNREGGNTGKLLQRGKRLEKNGQLKVINLAQQ